MFSGRYGVTLDDKGRIAVPAAFRHVLAKGAGGPLYFTPQAQGDGPHVEVYPAEKFFEIAAQIDNLEDRDEAEILKAHFIERSVAVELDAQGRVGLPPWVREEGGLENGRVVITGRIARFDIWDESRYQARSVDPERLKQAFARIKR